MGQANISRVIAVFIQGKSCRNDNDSLGCISDFVFQLTELGIIPGEKLAFFDTFGKTVGNKM